MAKNSVVLSSFQLGEVSARHHGRVDIQQYPQFCEEVRNMIPLPAGGMKRRAGSQKITSGDGTWNATLLAAQKARKIRFKASNGKKFMIVAVGGETITNGWRAIDASTGAALGMGATSDANKLWSADEVMTMQWAQSGDVIAVTQRDHRPIFIKYNGSTFTTANHYEAYASNYGYEIISRRAFLEPETFDINARGSLTLSGAGPTYTLSSSAGIFQPGHEGACFKLSDGGKTGGYLVTAYTNATTVSVTEVWAATGTTAALIAAGALGLAANPDSSWEEEAWSTYRGFPCAVTFYNGRCCYGGTYTHPNRLFMSQIGDIDELMYIPFQDDPAYTNFAGNNDRAFDEDLSAAEPPFIEWLASGKKIFVGCTDREFTVGGVTGATTSFGKLNRTILATTSFGSKRVKPIRASNSVIFVQESGMRLRDVTFSFDEDDYKSDDLNRLADTLTVRSSKMWGDEPPGRIVVIAYQTQPYPVVWVVDDLGGLFSFVKDKDSGTMAWSHHYLGAGENAYAETAPRVICAETLLSPDGGNDDLWLIVQRADGLHLEKIAATFDGYEYRNTEASIANKLVYLDAVERYYSASVRISSITITRFANKYVSVFADDKLIMEDYLVPAHGEIVFPAGTLAYTVLVGFKYKHRMATVGLEGGGQYGPAKGTMKKYAELVVGVYKTLFLRVGVKPDQNVDQLEEVPLYDYAQADASGRDPLFTGERRMHLPGYARDFKLLVESDKPYPCEISYLAAKGVTYD